MLYGGDIMKRRYNHETKQWDIVLSEDAYYHLIHQLESLRQHVSRQAQVPKPLGPYEAPNPRQSPFWYSIFRNWK